jgi:DNA-binding response OmpR family regulator
MPHIVLIEDGGDRATPTTAPALDSEPGRGVQNTRAAAFAPPDTPHDLISLRLVLPRREGYRLLRVLRDEGVDVPMVIMTAHGRPKSMRGVGADRRGDVGGSDALLDIVARLENLLDGGRHSRRPGDDPGAIERFGDVEVDCAARSVRRGGVPVSLTPMEFDLLRALIACRGAVASRLDLLREVWGYSAGATSRTVDTHVANLRRKLERDPSSPRHILTVWKAGYRLQR